jgi:hypothetical protein
MRTFLTAAAAQFVSYFVLVVQTRFIAKGSYLGTLITDAFFIAQGFFVSKWMVEAKDARGKAAFAGFMVGGCSGSLLAILFTEVIYHG